MLTKETATAAYRWLRPAQVAADPRLGVSVKQVRRYVDAGELVALDVSSPGAKRPTWRIDPASVEAMIRRRTRKAAA